MSFRSSNVVARVTALLFTIFALIIVVPDVDAFATARPLANQQKLSVATSSPSFYPPSTPYRTSTTVERYMTSSSDDSNDLKTPLDRPALALSDLFALLLFAYIGTSSHNSASDFVAVLSVALPFVVSWFVTTPFLGLYKQGATSDKMTALTTTAKGWIVAIPLGCVLRGIIKGYVPPLPFVVVTLVATLVVLGGTRVAFTAISEKVSE